MQDTEPQFSNPSSWHLSPVQSLGQGLCAEMQLICQMEALLQDIWCSEEFT